MSNICFCIYELYQVQFFFDVLFFFLDSFDFDLDLDLVLDFDADFSLVLILDLVFFTVVFPLYKFLYDIFFRDIFFPIDVYFIYLYPPSIHEFGL